MGKKATKKFAARGQLKKTIEARHKARQIKKKFNSRKTPRLDNHKAVSEDEPEEQDGVKKGSKNAKHMTVDSFLNGDFMDESGEENIEDDGEMDIDSEDEDDAEAYDSDENASFASVDDLDDAGQNHLRELSKLAEKDPEFYKYLQENDKELLDFDPDADPSNAEDGEVPMEDKTPVLTKEHLRKWQQSLLQHNSLRALRKILIAFRSAAHMNEDGQVVAWSIDTSSVYSKLVSTVLRYTPVVLEHHIPYKTLPNGKIKPPTQTQKFKTLQKLVLSHFHNIVHMLPQLTDEDMLRLALSESAKLLPYVLNSRKLIKTYLKKCLEFWSSSSDSIRIAAFLSVRRLAAASNDAILDNILKSTYLALIRSSKSTNAHTLPSINLMKNSASDVFCLDHATAYQHAFGYIRQLAIHLRNSMKVKTKETYKNVYNWQFVHCVDFWCTVLGRACDTAVETAKGKSSELRLLIYPLVQVSLGAIKLVPSGRSHPFHLQIIRSLLNLSRHTQTYIPLSTYVVPILSTCLTPSSRPKSSTLKPLDFDLQIRVPQQYTKTRVLSEGLTEEAAFLLTEWLVSEPVHGSIGFPEIVVPIVVLLRKSLKASNAKPNGPGSGKEQGIVKVLLERVEESARWVEQKRKNVTFAPAKMDEVNEWESEIKRKLGESPLGKYLKVLTKTREKRRSLLEKAREGQDEILDDD